MAYTEAQNKATQKYLKKNFDNIVVRVPKGEREAIKEHAKANGYSMQVFIEEAIKEKMGKA